MTNTALHLPDPAARPDFYAGVVTKRSLAWLIDLAIVTVVAAVIVPFTLFVALFFFPFLVLCVGFFYRWATFSSAGATWGMRLMAIELRDKDGDRPDALTALWHAFGTTMAFAVFPLHFVSIAMILMGPRRQSLMDNLLGTAMLNRSYTPV